MTSLFEEKDAIHETITTHRDHLSTETQAVQIERIDKLLEDAFQVGAGDNAVRFRIKKVASQ